VTRFVPARGLDENVARGVLLPAVERVKRALRDEMRDRAPDGKVWMTARDERVRQTHVHADSQEIPANLRYVLEVPGRGGQPTGEVELARRPRDPDLSIANAINCRCESVSVPDAVARQIHDHPAVLAGTRVRATVTCDYHRVVESEYPEQPDGGGRWAGSAVADVARRISDVARRT
jgi:hypothetical protein